jgi:hypothetical protein
VTTRNPVTARRPTSEWKDRCSRGDDEWEMSHNKAESYESGSYSARTDQKSADANAFCTALMNVCVESYHNAGGIDRQDRRGYLARVDQIVSPSADVDGALEFSKKSALRLPGDAVRKSSLDLKAFLTLHPRVNRGEYIARISGNSSGGSGEARTSELSHQAAFFRNIDSGSFLGEGLVHGRWTQANFIPYLSKLRFTDKLARLRHGTRALQLRCAREYPLERLSIEERLSGGKGRFLIGHAELYLLKSPRVRHPAGESARREWCRAD